MRGVDTNILVRYITADDPEQTRLAKDLIEQGQKLGEHFYISTVVLCELVWVLRFRYRFGRNGIVQVLETLFHIQTFEIEDRDLARYALEDFRRGPADFPDYLIGWRNRRAGCSETLTFDQDLKKSAGFSLLTSRS